MPFAPLLQSRRCAQTGRRTRAQTQKPRHGLHFLLRRCIVTSSLMTSTLMWSIFYSGECASTFRVSPQRQVSQRVRRILGRSGAAKTLSPTKKGGGKILYELLEVWRGSGNSQNISKPAVELFWFLVGSPWLCCLSSWAAFSSLSAALRGASPAPAFVSSRFSSAS